MLLQLVDIVRIAGLLDGDLGLVTAMHVQSSNCMFRCVREIRVFHHDARRGW